MLNHKFDIVSYSAVILINTVHDRNVGNGTSNVIPRTTFIVD